MKSNLELIARAARMIETDKSVGLDGKSHVDEKTMLIEELRNEVLGQNITAMAAIDQMRRVLDWFNSAVGRNIVRDNRDVR